MIIIIIITKVCIVFKVRCCCIKKITSIRMKLRTRQIKKILMHERQERKPKKKMNN